MTAEYPPQPWWRRVDPAVPAWLLGALVVWGVRGFQDGLSRDSALYVYAGQLIADGGAPYVGVLNRAGPLAQLLPGLGVELGRFAGLGDVVGVRAAFFLLVAATPALTYVLTRDVFGSRLAGSVAAATLLAFPGLALSATDGPQSKQPMMLGLLVVLVLLSRRRWLAAGVVTALATLTWQPVVVVLLAAAVAMILGSPGDRRSRLADLARFLAGGALVLAVTLGYFLLNGALAAFVEGFWTINAGYTAQQGVVAMPERAWVAVTAWLGWTTGLFLAGGLLSVVLGALALRRRASGAAVAALGAASLAGIAWSALAFNGAPDSMLLLPLAATGVGGGAAFVIDRVPRRTLLAVAVAGWGAVALATTAHVTLTDRTTELTAARLDAEAPFATLPADATVFAFNAPQPLALTGHESISRYLLFGEGMKQYVASESDDGIRGYVDRLREARPTLIVTPDRGLGGFLRPFARDYVEIDGGTGWRAWLREEPMEQTRGSRGASAASRDPWSLPNQEP